jgi:hypothetical protein
MCGINTFERLEAKVRLYARHMPCIGAYFMYGLPPLQSHQAEMEMIAIDDLNKRSRGTPINRPVRSVIETILRVSQRQREGDHV